MNYDQIRSKIYLRTKTNVTSLPNASLNLYTQPAEDRIASLIIQADGRWQYDDLNRTDLPIATTALVSGQQDYSIAVTHLELERVEVKNSGSHWIKLRPLDGQDEPDVALSERAATESGIPDEYDVLGNTVLLYPVPNYSLSAALKLYFKRGPLKYDYTANSSAGQFTDGSGAGATIDTPGFNSLYHDLIVDWASYNFSIDNTLSTGAGLLAEIQRKEDSLIKDYANRNRDDAPSITMSIPNFY